MYHYLERFNTVNFSYISINYQLKMFNHDLKESQGWLYFDQLCGRNRLLNKLANHFIIFYLFY